MSKVIYRGVVIEKVRDGFKVEFGNQEICLCYLSGKMWIHKIKVVLGDYVEFELSPDRARGRIIKRL